MVNKIQKGGDNSPKQKINYSYFQNLVDSLKVIIFNENSLYKIAYNSKATLYGFITLAIYGLLSSISTLNPLLIIGNMATMLIAPFISFSIYNFIAKYIFGGEATGVQYFRSISNLFIIFWLSAIPKIGTFILILGIIWLIAVNIFVLKKVHKLATWKAVILGLLPLILIAIFFLGAGLILLGA